MGKQTIIRVLELIDNPLLDDSKTKDPNLVHFAFAEYLQNDIGGRVSTDRVFQLQDLINKVDMASIEGDMIASQMEWNKELDTDIYQFQFQKDCNLKPTHYSNHPVPTLAVVIPGKMKKDNMDDEQLIEIEEYLQRKVLEQQSIADIRSGKKKCHLEKSNSIIKTTITVAITLSAGLFIASKLGKLLKAQQEQQRLLDEQNRLQNRTIFTEELQEQNRVESIDPELEFLENIHEEHESLKKMQ